MLLQNITLNNQYPYRRLGATAVNTETGYMISQHGIGNMRQFCRFTAFPKNSGFPSGYNPGIFMPLLQNEMSSWREADLSISISGQALRGYPIEGSSSLSITSAADILPEDDTSPLRTASASLSITVADLVGELISFGFGTASLEITTNNPFLSGTLSGLGTASFQLTTNTPILGAEAELTAEALFSFTMGGSMLPADDSNPARTAATSFSFSGSLSPYAIGHMIGNALPYTELSPQSLAKEVWNSVAADNNDAGTMGAKVNASGSSGDPWGTELPGSYGEDTAGEALYRLFKRKEIFIRRK